MKKKYWRLEAYPGAKPTHNTTKDLIEFNFSSRQGTIESLEAKIESLTELVAALLDNRKSMDEKKIKEFLNLRHNVTEITEATYNDNRWG